MRSLFCLLSMSLIATAPASADIGDNGVGLNTHHPSDAYADLAADLGLNWIRVDANWFQLQPGRDRYDWAHMDAIVDRANARGLNVYMTLAYTPEWVPRVPSPSGDAYVGNDEPVGSAEWTAFVTAAVTRYAARGVTHFGIWNEPNLGGFFEGTADAYIDKILVPGSDAVRRTCGSCVVLGPDLAHVGDYDVFLDRVMSRASGSFDILAHHIYSGWAETGTGIFDGDRFLEALEMRRFSFTRISLRELLDRHGWTGEVWITETGYRAGRIGDPSDEMRQATYVRRVMEEQLLRAWWTNSLFYEAVDCGIDQPGCDIDGFGIARPLRDLSAGPRSFPGDFRLKPAFTTIRDFIAAHPEYPGVAPATPPPPPTTGDAGMPSADAGPSPSSDAGTVVPPTPSDAGTMAGADGGIAVPPGDGGATSPPMTSTGCSAAPGASGFPLAMLVVLPLMRLRRRPRGQRSSRSPGS